MPQVHIDETDDRYDYTVLGVMTANPNTFTLPHDSLDPAVFRERLNEVYRYGQVRF